MDETHRELLLKRQKYLRENVIMEEGLLLRLKDKGIFTGTMVSIIQAEPDPDRQMLRMLEMIPKRGPDAYKKFMECLEEDYPWIVRNFKEKETELLRQTRADSDVTSQTRQDVKDYVRELARTTRINNAQKRAIEDFLCRHITIDTNLNNATLPGNKLYGIHKKLLAAIHLASLDESDQMDLNDILPENVTIEKIEKEVSYLVNRIKELETVIDGCYDKLGETNKEKDLVDLVYTQRKIALERGIKMEEMKDQIFAQQKKVRLAKDRERKAQEASQKIEEEKEDVERSLEMLKGKIHRLQEERQRMGMRVAFDSSTTTASSTVTTAGLTTPSSPRSRSSKSQDWGKNFPYRPHSVSVPSPYATYQCLDGKTTRQKQQESDGLC